MQAQITVTAATFPKPGDTLYTALDTIAAGIELTAPGPNQNWDFRSLKANTRIATIYRDPSTGTVAAEFPTATAMISLPGNRETYFRATPTTFENLGGSGIVQGGFGGGGAIKFDKPYVLRRSPLTYAPAQVSRTDAGYAFRFSFSSLPSFIRDSLLSLLPFQVDSMGFGFSQGREDRVDAWGKLSIPDGTFNVLRERRVETTAAKVEVKLPFVGWRDITTLLSGGGGGGIGGLGGLGSDTTLSYHFFSDVSKEPVAIMTMNDDWINVAQVEYRSRDAISSASDAGSLAPVQVRVYPNPSSGYFKIDLEGMDQAEFSVSVYQLNGQAVLEQKFRQGSTGSMLEVNGLLPGVYAAVAKNLQGEVLAIRLVAVSHD